MKLFIFITKSSHNHKVLLHNLGTPIVLMYKRNDLKKFRFCTQMCHLELVMLCKGHQAS